MEEFPPIKLVDGTEWYYICGVKSLGNNNNINYHSTSNPPVYISFDYQPARIAEFFDNRPIAIDFINRDKSGHWFCENWCLLWTEHDRIERLYQNLLCNECILGEGFEPSLDRNAKPLRRDPNG